MGFFSDVFNFENMKDTLVNSVKQPFQDTRDFAKNPKSAFGKMQRRNTKQLGRLGFSENNKLVKNSDSVAGAALATYFGGPAALGAVKGLGGSGSAAGGSSGGGFMGGMSKLNQGAGFLSKVLGQGQQGAQSGPSDDGTVEFGDVDVDRVGRHADESIARSTTGTPKGFFGSVFTG